MSDEMESWMHEQAHEWACIRAIEEGDVDIDRDYVIMEAWEEEYYNWLKELYMNKELNENEIMAY